MVLVAAYLRRENLYMINTFFLEGYMLWMIVLEIHIEKFNIR